MTQGMVKPITAGRMGNFLFQAAAAMSYAWDHGMEYTLPDTTNSPVHNPIYLQHLVRPNFDKTLPQVVVEEQQFCHHERPFKEEWKSGNILLQGWWQTEKYFAHYRERILKEFGFLWKPVDGVAVHVRRGDYLRLRNKHPEVPISWILKAMNLFPGKVFYFFSDDIRWCQKTFGHRSDCIFASTNNPEADLVMGSCMAHQICSASTFSWWIYYLNRNPNKRGIFPRLWYVPGHGGLDVKDIWPSGCEHLD